MQIIEDRSIFHTPPQSIHCLSKLHRTYDHGFYRDKKMTINDFFPLLPERKQTLHS